MRRELNLVLCLITVFMGITGTIYKVRYEGGFLTCFREMTVCVTVLTTLTSAALAVLNLVEIRLGSEVNSPALYFFRLSLAVTEFLVPVTVLIGFLPIFTDHPVIGRYDMIGMHVLIPLLTVGTFVFNDSAVGKVSRGKLLYGLTLISVYIISVLALILTGVIPENKIPYSCLDVRNQPFWYPLFAFVFLYGIGYLMSWVFYRLNLKLSWRWYRGVAADRKRPGIPNAEEGERA